MFDYNAVLISKTGFKKIVKGYLNTIFFINLKALLYGTSVVLVCKASVKLFILIQEIVL